MTKVNLFVMAILALAAPILALQTTPQNAQTTGIVRGVVVRDGTAEPIPDVQIVIGGRLAQATAIGVQAGLDAVAASFGPALLNTLIQQGTLAGIAARGAAADTTPQFTATSDASGRFVIEGIPPGQYAVTAQREGYFAPQLNGVVPNLVRMNVAVTSQQATGTTISMVPGSNVSGRIVSPTGSPLADVSVEVLRVLYQNGLPAFQAAGAKQTDDRGEYRLFRLPPGEYYLAATARPGIVPAAPANASATPQERQVRTFYPGVTDSSAAVPLVLRGGEDLSGMNLQIRTAAGATLSGRVISALPAAASAAPAPGVGARGFAVARGNVATLTLLPHDRNAVADLIANTTSVLMSSPNDGVFQIANILPGSYDLFASLPDPSGYGPAAGPGQATQPVAYGRASVDVRGANVDNIAITVHQGVDVTGRVTVDGKPTQANVRISLQSADSAARIAVFQQVSRFQPMIEQDGSFRIPVVPEATYRFQVTIGGARGLTPPQPLSALPPGAYIADIRQGSMSVYDEGIRVATEQVLPVEVMVGTNGGAIDGIVLGADQQPATDATIVLAPSQTRRQNLALYKTATAGPDGRFVLTGLPPEQYKLFAWPTMQPSSYQNPEFMKKYEDRGVAVVVSAGARTTHQVPLIK